MRLNSTRRRLLASTMICGAAFAAFAASPAAAQDDTVQEILVTGSRILQPNLVTTSPVTQVTAEDITTQGVTRIEDLMNALPQAFAAQNSNISNGATGTASVDLRGQGASRTMVLIDGKRMPYGSPNYIAADLNQIPGPLVDRVEVLTGGASAVYGSDALSGVVNFIMKRNFQGLQLDSQYGFYQHTNDYDGPGDLRARIAARAATNPSQFALPADDVNDGFSKEITVIFGANSPDGRGNVTAYASWRHNDEVMQRDRDYSACTIDANAVPTTVFSCGGSGTAATARFLHPLGAFSLTPDANNPGQFRNFVSSLDQYNYGPLDYYQRPDERYSIGAFAKYEIRDGMEAYADLMFTDSHTVAQIAPSGFFLGDTLDSVNCGNPLLTEDMALDLGCTLADIANDDSVTTFIGRRNVEGGPRQDDLTHQSYRIVAGLRGDLFEDWTYDVSAQYSTVLLAQVYRNEFSKTRGMRAIDLVDADPGPDVDVQCRSFVNGTDLNCVPYDLFSVGGVTQAALDYVSLTLFASGRTEQQLVTATIGGDLGGFGLRSSLADRAFQGVFGVEYRREKLVSESDDAYESGDGWGQGGPNIGLGGAFDVYDAFLEVEAPLVEGRTYADLISVDFAYRKSHYSTDKDTNSYKVGVEWAPSSDVRFRGSYQRAVRAANVIELYRAQSVALFDGEDPCGTPALDPGAIATAAECAATGVPGALFGSVALDSPAGQYNQFAGGNPDLDPEESDTWTLGAVFTPSFIPGLVMSVDWFDIYIDRTIGTFGAQNTLDACYDLNLTEACDRIHRTPGGLLWVSGGFVENLNINTGYQGTSGYDINASYTTSLEQLGFANMGDLSFNFVGTLLDEYSYNPGAGDDIECVGLMDNSCGTPNPEWRHRLRASWRTPWDIEASLTWRHYGEVSMEGVTTARIDRDFPSYDWFDLAGSWRVRDNLTLKGGVNNIFDKDPPLSGSLSGGNGNTYPQVYDAMGRFVFMRATVDF